MSVNKKAVTVTLTIDLRIIVDTTLDLDSDYDDLNKATLKVIQERIKEEGVELIGESITDYYEDTDNPYDPEYDV